MPAAPTFRLKGVTAEPSGVPALCGIDLEVTAGEAVALVGPSGAGKTTLLRTLGGTLAPTRGAAFLEGVALEGLSPRALRRARARVGFIHQEHALVPNVRVAANVIAGGLGQRSLVAGLRSMAWPARADLERAHAILERLGVADKLFQRTDSLSGGERQRVAIARALFQAPTAMLADEPVASVDPERARALIGMLRDLAREEGLTLVVSLHDLELARAFFPRLVGLRSGRLVFDGPPDALAPEDYAALYALEES